MQQPTQNHKYQQLQLVVGPLWPWVMVPVGVLLVGRMDQNMNLKEKWVYEEKWDHIKIGSKSYIVHICKPDLALNNPFWLMCRETQTINQLLQQPKSQQKTVCCLDVLQGKMLGGN